MMGESENIIVRESLGIFGQDEGIHKIAGDNEEVCESKRKRK